MVEVFDKEKRSTSSECKSTSKSLFFLNLQLGTDVNWLICSYLYMYSKRTKRKRRGTQSPTNQLGEMLKTTHQILTSGLTFLLTLRW